MKKNGMLVALMEEYRKAALEYKDVLTQLTSNQFIETVDKETKSVDCQSIQNLTFHVVQSGYTYANYIQSIQNENWLEYEEEIPTTEVGIVEIDKMLDYTELIFDTIYDESNKVIEQWVFKTRWGVIYDFEQLMEHAIVHILRHRRQVVNFLKERKK
ncbi:MAG: putative damage-inducible protein DinB [Aureispira sp.]|jgi:uncharacterized damage-inducible protein DinB